MNLFHDLKTGPNAPQEVFSIIEIPSGCSNKYEFDKDSGAIFLDRVLYGATYYPTEYGLIPRTWNTDDGDPLDIMVINGFPVHPGVVVTTRIIGAAKLDDNGENDNKILGVSSKDPRLNHIQSIDDLPKHHQDIISNFLEIYPILQPKKVTKFLGWASKEEAINQITVSMKAYEEKFKK